MLFLLFLLFLLLLLLLLFSLFSLFGAHSQSPTLSVSHSRTRQLQYKTKVEFTKDALKGDKETQLQITLVELLEDAPPPED